MTFVLILKLPRAKTKITPYLRMTPFDVKLNIVICIFVFVRFTLHMENCFNAYRTKQNYSIFFYSFNSFNSFLFF